MVHEGQELTAGLLTCIEENNSHRQMFGFNVIGSAPAKTTGDTAIAHCRRIAQDLLVKHPSGKWEDEKVDRLAVSVKNRINS